MAESIDLLIDILINKSQPQSKDGEEADTAAFEAIERERIAALEQERATTGEQLAAVASGR